MIWPALDQLQVPSSLITDGVENKLDLGESVLPTNVKYNHMKLFAFQIAHK